MKKEAIILAGGKGTRLQSVVSDLPKPMADVAGIPFLVHQLNYLITQGVESVILSVGYKAEVIYNYFGDSYQKIALQYAYEEYPLGTGGAVLNALRYTTASNVYVLNGDTYFPISLTKLDCLHRSTEALISMALRSIESDGRYGGTNIDVTGRVVDFTAKDQTGIQLINGGIYLINVAHYLAIVPEQKSFSFEEDILKSLYKVEPLYGTTYYDYFIDIGIPVDYVRANTELSYQNQQRENILFLDRDGVINRKINDGYVISWDSFNFLPRALFALQILADKFDKILVITNQRGIARGLMTEANLADIHQQMTNAIELAGGRIDGIYVCPHHSNAGCGCRKPEVGLIEKAKQDFPIINTANCYFVGDSESDMVLGRRMGYRTVLIQNDGTFDYSSLNLADEVYLSLERWVISITLLA